MTISCTARKPILVHIRDWIDFQRSHMKIHGDTVFNLNDVDYVFGFVEEDSPLYGGRVRAGGSITRMDAYWCYDNDIGIKIPLSSKSFSDQQYKDSREVLEQYHREGNAIIITNHKLAERLKNDYPKYKLEASAIMAVDTKSKLDKVVGRKLYDHIVLPIAANDDMKLLESIEDKEQIRLFINAECSYNCPSKVCYGTTGQINSGKSDKMICSHWDLKMPRTWYDNSVDWSSYYFDIGKFNDMGFSHYKMVTPEPLEQRTNIMVDTRYKNN
jgi:hypothetical protein